MIEAFPGVCVWMLSFEDADMLYFNFEFPFAPEPLKPVARKAPKRIVLSRSL